MKKIIAKKVEMTQIFSETGEVFPVTLVKGLQGKTLPDDLQGLALQEGDMVTVSGTSKGKGFQGVVKRHGFTGGPRSHGQKHSEREPGSIGGGLRTHVPKGMRMAGRMGSDRITQKNLKVVSVDKENNIMLIKGAIAGKRGSLVEIVCR